jgi:hypothetical protein
LLCPLGIDAGTICSAKEGFSDVIAICEPIVIAEAKQPDETEKDNAKLGYVYLMKSGRYFKIGRSNSIGRREYELSVQMPEKLQPIHWHKRFAERRKNGEWFELTSDDIKAFKRRKFM